MLTVAKMIIGPAAHEVLRVNHPLSTPVLLRKIRMVRDAAVDNRYANASAIEAKIESSECIGSRFGVVEEPLDRPIRGNIKHLGITGQIS